MNISISNCGALKEELYKGDVDFSGTPHTFKALLMRPSFSFTSNHKYLKNIKGTSGAITYNTSASARTFTVTAGGSGSLITDGFLVGNYVTTSDGIHTGTYQITSVTATVMTVNVVTGAAITDTTGTSGTITANDEHDATGGYTPGGLTVTFTVSGNTLTLDTFDLSDFGATALAESPGAFIYDDTNTLDVGVIYIRFSDWNLYV